MDPTALAAALLAHSHGVNGGRSPESTNRDWNVIAPSGTINDIGEQKCPALFLGKSALKLPTHQGMQLTILVDSSVNARKEPLRVEQSQMVLKIERRPAARCAMR